LWAGEIIVLPSQRTIEELAREGSTTVRAERNAAAVASREILTHLPLVPLPPFCPRSPRAARGHQARALRTGQSACLVHKSLRPHHQSVQARCRWQHEHAAT
jgi:hypothetical protein